MLCHKITICCHGNEKPRRGDVRVLCTSRAARHHDNKPSIIPRSKLSRTLKLDLNQNKYKGTKASGYSDRGKNH